MIKISHKVKVTCIKSNLSKTIDFDKYSEYQSRYIFDFYANHSDYLIELVWRNYLFSINSWTLKLGQVFELKL